MARTLARFRLLVCIGAAVLSAVAGPTFAPAAPTIQIEEWTVPWPDTRPRDPFVAPGSTPNRLVGSAPASEAFLSITPIPSGGGSVRHVYFDSRTGDLWFGTDAGTVGRARLRPVINR